MGKFKKWLIPIAVVCLLVAILAGGNYASQPLGEIFDPSGNPFAHRFSDMKDIRTATFVVAASDSEHRYEADYFCDGTADDVQMQAALDALPATGGCIFLLDGTYTLANQIARAIDDVRWMGCGHATLLNLDGVTPVITAGVQDSWLFLNFGTDAGGVDISTATESAIRSVWIAGVRTDDPAAGAAGGDAVITVAANNTPAQQKARADFVCTGANDDATIEAHVAAGVTIKLMVGTYVFGASLDILVSNFVLEGSGPGTIISGTLDNTHYIVVGDGATALSNIVIRNLRIDGTAQTGISYGIYFYGASGHLVDDCVVEDCIIKDCYYAGICMDYNAVGHGHRILDNHIESCVRGIHTLSGNAHNAVIEGNTFKSNTTHAVYPPSGSTVVGNDFFQNAYGIYVGYSNCLIAGNSLYDGTNDAIYIATDDVYISGNRIASGTGGNGIHVYKKNSVMITGNVIWDVTLNGIFLEGAMYCTITGNILDSNDNHGIKLGWSGVAVSYYNVIVGNNLAGNGTGTGTWSEIFLDKAKFNIIQGNFIRAWQTEYGIREESTLCDHNIIEGNHARHALTADITIQGVCTQAYENWTEDHYFEQRLLLMKNTSGGNLVIGDVVVLKAVAAGNEVTTTVTEGDQMVFGMLAENINDNAWGWILVEGKTVVLKVNGTTDIAIGDLLGTHTDAGIAMKAAAGKMAFAIALGVYATDDSNGVIDALLITPRQAI